MDESQLNEITEETERKISKLFQQYPCLKFTCTTEKFTSRVKDVCLNEQYINELGYSLESFATIALQEGLPP